MMGSVYRWSNMLPSAFVRERVCSIHGDIARVGFGRMSITIACVSRIVDGGSVVVLSIGSAIFAFEITKRSAFDRRTLCPLEETANFVPIHKLQVRLMFSLGLPSSTFNNSPRSFYFFKTIPNIGIFIFGTFFLNLKIFRIIIKRFFEFFLNSWLDFTHDRLIAFPFIELNKISYSIVFLRTNFNNDLSV